MRKPKGHGTKINREIINDIAEQIEIGIPPRVASENAGISNRTYQRWMKRGKEAHGNDIFNHFRRRIELAKKRVTTTLVREIFKHNDWKGKKYILECIDPKIWKPGEQLNIQGEVKHETKMMPDEVLIEYVNICREAAQRQLRAADSTEPADTDRDHNR